MVELLPSILSADFAHLADQVAAAERGGGTTIHVDIMDGTLSPTSPWARLWSPAFENSPVCRSIAT